jgi:perosamine synthetase
MSSFFDEACNTDMLLHRALSPATFPETLAFEATLAQVFGVKEAIAVASGTGAIHCALAALGIGPGDEVLIPALAVVMSVVPIVYQGATPIFVDSAPDRIDFDYQDLESKVSPRTKAILPVYLWGCSYDMDRLLHFAQLHNLVVVEDACQAHGSQWSGHYLGTLGAIGCFSLRDPKLIATYEGGFLLTNSQELAEKYRGFRTHFAASNPLYSYQQRGHNYRLTEFQAWLGRKQVENLGAILARRYGQSIYLLNGLSAELASYHYAAQERSNLFSPVFLLNDEDAEKDIARALALRGVPNSVGTFGLQPVYKWPVFSEYAPPAGSTPHAKQFLSRTLAISLLPQHTEADLDGIIATIKTTLAEGR